MKEMLIRTICIKLEVDGHADVLAATQRAFNDAATWISLTCWRAGITNTNTAHHRVYGDTRTRFGLGAQLAVCARAKAMEAIKAVKAAGKNTCPLFGPRSSMRYDARTYRLMSLDRVSLNSLSGRVVCRLVLGPRQHAMLIDPAWTIGGADLVWRRGVYSLHVTQTSDAPDLPKGKQDRLGVDLGIVNLATDSTGQRFSGGSGSSVRKRDLKRRALLQSVGTRSAKRRLQKISKRESRFQKDVNHSISKALVAKASHACKALALEDLTGINEQVTVRHEHRYAPMSWAFYHLRLFLTYKAMAAGVRVVVVDPRNTSKTCSACGYCSKRNRQSQASFHCRTRDCGMQMNADVNAAINISRAEVKRPMVASAGGR